MVGLMMIKQPFYIGGIDDPEEAKKSAIGAAMTFFFTFVISISYLFIDSRRHNNANNGSETEQVTVRSREYDMIQMRNYRDYREEPPQQQQQQQPLEDFPSDFDLSDAAVVSLSDPDRPTFT